MQSELIRQEAANALTAYRNRTTAFPSESVAPLSRRAVALFFEYFNATGNSLRPAIELLCEIVASPDLEHNRIGLAALFPGLIEKLNDAFEPAYCELYDRLFAQVISFYRRLPEGQALDLALHRFGLGDEAAILSRKRALLSVKKNLPHNRPLKKALFLSRVTIGADVAVTSVLLARIRELFPAAELVLLGSKKLRELFGGDSRLRVRSLDYGRGGSLLARLSSWLAVVAAVEDEITGLHPQEYCLFDPDSRLTQLGLLPVLSPPAESASYHFFESRSFSHPGVEKLGQLTSHWMDNLCGEAAETTPYISLSAEVLSIGREVLSFLRSPKHPHVFCLSFGTGGNPIKRVSEQFEIELATALSAQAKLIIDRGATKDETEQVNRIVAALEARGKTVISLTEEHFREALSQRRISPDVLTWQGSIGSLASLIAASNEYIGYDSSGQHLAAALRIPTLTIFVNSGANHFPVRWQPHGAGRLQVVSLEPSLLDASERFVNELLAGVLLQHDQLRDG
jgi:ADP-heptose:LPS heptosyltransferase